MEPLPGMPAPRRRQTTTNYPARLRVWGGRVVHAAEEVAATHTHRTACGRAFDHRRSGGALLDPATEVTCTACLRATVGLS